MCTVIVNWRLFSFTTRSKEQENIDRVIKEGSWRLVVAVQQLVIWAGKYSMLISVNELAYWIDALENL